MRLLRGAPGSGKTAQIFREFHAVGPGTRIVVPTATLVRHYQHELARSGLVFDPGAVVSLSRLAQQLAGPTAQLASPSLVRTVVKSELARAELTRAGSDFAAVSETPGMADVILETITLFENADCTPDRLARVRNLTPHAKAFHRIWKNVETALTARGFMTRGQLFRHAATNSTPATPPTIYLDAFLRLSPLELNLIRAIAPHTNLTLTLSDLPATRDLHRFALELGATDRLLPGAPRRPQTTSVLAPTPEREADEIARRILELHTTGVPFPAIAVALRDPDTWLPLLRTTFARFAIPARFYFPAPLRHHPVAAFLGGLLANAISGFDFALTLAALRSHPQWGHSADFDRFDFAVREAMPNRGVDELLALCDSERLKTNLAEALSIAKWRGEKARPDQWRRRFTRLAERLYRLRTLPDPTDYAAIETARTHAAGLRAFADATETSATAANFWTESDGLIAFERFAEVVLSVLNDADMRPSDDRQDVVHVMHAFEARQWEVRALFVPGMTARDYPRHRPQNLLFPDADLDRLRAAGIPVPTAAEADRDEAQLFEVLKTRASETLILTTSARDTSGQSAVPSAYFTGPIHRSHLSTPEGKLDTRRQPRSLISSLDSLAAQHQRISITALEDLAKCRFRFFAGRTLKLAGVPDLPADRLQPKTIGSIFHKAMEDWLTDRTRNFVDIFERTFEDFCNTNHVPSGYTLEVERCEARRIARQVNLSARWPSISSEAEVDLALDFPGGVTVTSRVDRIDHIGNGNCVIVDYKSGKVANVDKLLTSQTSLQGPLYALAVREKKQLNTVAMVFLAIREDKPVGWGEVPGAGDLGLTPIPENWVESARARTEARLADFLSGDIHPEPTAPDNCQWCDYKTTCRIEQREAEVIQVGAANAN